MGDEVATCTLMYASRMMYGIVAIKVGCDFAGENVEELFTRIASVTFEKVMKSEIEATNSIQTSAGQLAQNSALISEFVCMCVCAHTF